MNRTNPFAVWGRRRDHNLDGMQGVQVEGDPSVPPTPINPLKLFWYIHFVWRTVVVFEAADNPLDGLFIGFRNFRGEIYLREVHLPQPTRAFAIRVGHEPCTFFAVGRWGREISLKVVARTTKNDPDPCYINVWIY